MAKKVSAMQKHRDGISHRLDNINTKLDTLIEYVNGSKLSYETEISVLREMIEQKKIMSTIPDLSGLKKEQI